MRAEPIDRSSEEGSEVRRRQRDMELVDLGPSQVKQVVDQALEARRLAVHDREIGPQRRRRRRLPVLERGLEMGAEGCHGRPQLVRDLVTSSRRSASSLATASRSVSSSPMVRCRSEAIALKSDWRWPTSSSLATSTRVSRAPSRRSPVASARRSTRLVVWRSDRYEARTTGGRGPPRLRRRRRRPRALSGGRRAGSGSPVTPERPAPWGRGRDRRGRAGPRRPGPRAS